MMMLNAKSYFADAFSSGNFDAWSYVQGADPNQGGPGPQYCYITTPQKAGIMALDAFPYVAHFQVPAILAKSNPHAKLYKEFTNVGKKDQLGRLEQSMFNDDNASAIYTAWYYFPHDYVASTDWVDIFFFKEDGIPNAGGKAEVQNPSWWLNVAPASTFGGKDNAPVLFANNWGTDYNDFKPKVIALPLGRWFKISANLHEFTKNNPANRIDWYLDGVKFDTSRNTTYPVGTFYYQTYEWIWGVGHYQGVGELYVGNLSINNIN